MTDDRLIIAGREFKSRLWVGTGKYKNFVETQKAIEVSGADVVTVAVRRVNITDRSKDNLLDYLDPKKYTILPNTAGCYTVEDAVRYARLARAAGVSDLVKLEVLGDEKTLFPDTAGLIEAAKILIKEGFIVLPSPTTIRSSRRSWSTSDAPPSCPWRRRSDRGSESATPTI
jgi:thiazole synthase